MLLEKLTKLCNIPSVSKLWIQIQFERTGVLWLMQPSISLNLHVNEILKTETHSKILRLGFPPSLPQRSPKHLTLISSLLIRSWTLSTQVFVAGFPMKYLLSKSSMISSFLPTFHSKNIFWVPTVSCTRVAAVSETESWVSLSRYFGVGRQIMNIWTNNVSHGDVCYIKWESGTGV